MIFRDKRLGDLAALPAARAVNLQAFPVASRNNLEASVFLAGVCERKPYRQHVRVIGFLMHHAIILMPSGGSDEADPSFLIDITFGNFDPYVLDGV